MVFIESLILGGSMFILYTLVGEVLKVGEITYLFTSAGVFSVFWSFAYLVLSVFIQKLPFMWLRMASVLSVILAFVCGMMLCVSTAAILGRTIIIVNCCLMIAVVFLIMAYKIILRIKI